VVACLPTFLRPEDQPLPAGCTGCTQSFRATAAGLLPEYEQVSFQPLISWPGCHQPAKLTLANDQTRPCFQME
jgi:hypothetical protein